MPDGTLHGILKQAKLSIEEFIGVKIFSSEE
jgi:hypothetical protein